MSQNSKYNFHHPWPVSRGSPRQWKKKVLRSAHDHWNVLFGILCPWEAVILIQKCWRNKNNDLRYEILSEHQIKSWWILFGTWNIKKAVKIINKNWGLSNKQMACLNETLSKRKQKLKQKIKRIEKISRK